MTAADAHPDQGTFSSKPSLAVWKFASCDGCQLTLLDCEDELLAVADRLHIAYFLEASSATVEGPYDVSLVEGSITTPHDRERIAEVRRQSKYLITIGACATSGGIQALRNYTDVKELLSIVYATPSFIETLDTSTSIAEHVLVDFELRGCPIDRRQLLEVISAYLAGRKPTIASDSVCIECKLAGIACVAVAQGIPCIGPVTHAGCGALCPTYNRGCYGCFGPSDTPKPTALVPALRHAGLTDLEIQRLFHTFNAWAEPFQNPLPTPVAIRPTRSGTP